MSGVAAVSGSFVREQLRAPLTLVLLVAIPGFFVLIFAGVLGEFSKALGGTLATRSATAISAGWAAAFLSGTLGFFEVTSSRGADRRLAVAGLGGARVAFSRIAASLMLAAIVGAVAFVTLWLRSGIGHPLHAAVAIFSFAAIYIGIGAIVGRIRHGAARRLAARDARLVARRLLRPANDLERRGPSDADARRCHPVDRRRRRPRLTRRRLAPRRRRHRGRAGRCARRVLARCATEARLRCRGGGQRRRQPWPHASSCGVP
jgi:hypothetical protein